MTLGLSLKTAADFEIDANASLANLSVLVFLWLVRSKHYTLDLKFYDLLKLHMQF